MRNLLVSMMVVATALPAFAQTRPRRMRTTSTQAENAAAEVKQAMEQMGEYRKVLERDLEVLRNLREADAALVDAMQPSTAVQKALDHTSKAESLGPPFVVMQGVIRARQELENARRSPVSADFGRLRATLRDEALGPASRVAVRNAMRLEEEMLGWIQVQELVAGHLRTLSTIAGESLRASEDEK